MTDARKPEQGTGARRWWVAGSVALLAVLVAGALVVWMSDRGGERVAVLEATDVEREDGFTPSVAGDTTLEFIQGEVDDAGATNGGGGGGGDGGDARLTVIDEPTFVASLRTFDQSEVTLTEVAESLRFVPGIKAGAVDAKTEVLDTSVYGSLDPGSWMVFIAPFDDEADAAEYCGRVTEVAPDCAPVFVDLLGDVENAAGTNPVPEPDADGGVGAAEPVLYEGTAGAASCDQDALVGFLDREPDVAASWADVQGIDPDAIGSFVRGLTAVRLRADTIVVNHGVSDGQVTPFLSILQAGSGVLVDAKGTPRVRCGCGGPLVAPSPDQIDQVRAATRDDFDGDGWDDFDPAAAIHVVPADRAVGTVTLLDATTGRTIDRPFATTGQDDLTDCPACTTTTTTTAPPPTTVPTTTTSPPAPVLQQCGDIVFEANTEDFASEVNADGVSCDEATALVREVAQSHNFYSGPRAFEAGRFTCTVVTEDDILPVGYYTCNDGEASVTWTKS